MDELERELRRVLRDDRLRVEPDTDALDRVHRGAARRRRRRRAAAGGLSVASVFAVAVFAVATPLVNQQRAEDSAAGTSSAPEKADESAKALQSPRPTERASSSAPQRKTEPAAPVPADFAAASVTAMSPSSFWVLGTAPCDDAVCTSLVRTSDGGSTFRGVPAPEAPLAEGRVTGRTVTDVRFASSIDGFAYGGALWSTHDGGGTWTEQDVPGRVTRLEAERGTAWALVEKGDEYRLYRSSSSRDAWQRMSLPVQLDSVQPDLALQSGSVTLTGTSGQRAVSLVSANGGSSFQVRDRPCESALDATLSAFGSTLWMFCATGTQGRPYVSSDDGRTWRAVDSAPPPGGWSNATVVGARGSDTAVLASGTRLYTVSSGGGARLTREADGDSAYRYVGFTTSQVGYAVLDDPAPASLLRTTDGGRSWSPVHYS